MGIAPKDLSKILSNPEAVEEIATFVEPSLSDAITDPYLLESVWNKCDKDERAYLFKLLISSRSNETKVLRRWADSHRVGKANAKWQTPEFRLRVCEAADKIRQHDEVSDRRITGLIYKEITIQGDPDEADAKKAIRKILKFSRRIK